MTSVTRTKRGPYAPSLKRRKAIAEAVLDLVDELGHDGVTTALVAERSGMSETNVLYHFPSKDHLLVAALARSEELAAEGGSAYADAALLDPATFGAFAAREVDDNRFRLFVMLRGQAVTPDHPAGAHFAARAAHQIELFATLIRRSQAAGIAHPALDPVQAARQIIAVWDGLTNLWLTDDSFDIGADLEAAAARLLGQNVMELQKLIALRGL